MSGGDASTDGSRGRIYCLQSDPESTSEDALATQGESIYWAMGLPRAILVLAPGLTGSHGNAALPTFRRKNLGVPANGFVRAPVFSARSYRMKASSAAKDLSVSRLCSINEALGLPAA